MKHTTVAAGDGYPLAAHTFGDSHTARAGVLIVPVALLAGYFPGRMLGIVGDVPAGVMRQWRAWCLHRDYLFGVLAPEVRVRYSALKLLILSLSFTDDEFLSRRNIESLHAFYAGAAVETQRLSPRDVHVPRIGRFGFFRKRHESSLWPRVADWLDRHAGLHH